MSSCYLDSPIGLLHNILLFPCILQNIFKFWLEKGIDGILADGVHILFETEEVTLDEPPTEKEDIPEVTIVQ